MLTAKVQEWLGHANAAVTRLKNSPAFKVNF